MKMLIIYTYPNHSSLNYAFLQNVIKGSKKNPNIKELQILDLYDEEFNPLLVFNEQKRRRDMHMILVLRNIENKLLGLIRLFLSILFGGEDLPRCFWDI